MMHVEGLRIALRGIAANRMRSALTVLGITIGVAAVIILVAVGHGSAVAVQNRIESLGTNVLTIFSGGGGFRAGLFGGRQTRIGTASSFTSLTTKDVQALRDKTLAPDILTVSPVVNVSSVTVTYGSASYSPSQFVGSTPTFFAARDYAIAAGSLFTAQDELARAKVVVLGQTVVANLFGGQSPIGQTIKLNGANFQVVGVLAAKGSNGPQDQDDIAVAPLAAVQDSLAGGNTISQIIVQARSSKSLDAAQNEIYNVLASTHPSTSDVSSSFRVLNQSSLLQASSSTSRTFTVLLAAVAGISLLVGGIGVMNIMLVSVTERTREIGIRKAIGARRSDIVGQFLAESTLLSMLGGLVGVLAGIAGSRFTIVGVHPVIQLYSIVLAFVVAVGVGLFFGIYPANRAAMLRPIDALRYE